MKFRALSRRRLTRILLGATLLAVTGATAAAVPSWAGTTPVYVALGDSYAAGTGAPPYDPASGSCRRSPLSAAKRWADSHQANFTFAACSGDTTADVRNSRLGALSAATTLVTITIGGNDVAAFSVEEACLVEDDATCLQAVVGAEAQITTTLRDSLDQTFRAIKAEAPNARLIVLGYPRPFALTPGCPQLDAVLPGVDTYKRGLVDHGADLLDQVLQDRAAANGATFVDVRPAFAGHEICTDNPFILGISNPIEDSGHPNADGYRLGYLQPLLGVTG